MKIPFSGVVSACVERTSKKDGKPFQLLSIAIQGATIEAFPPRGERLEEGQEVRGSITIRFDEGGQATYRVEIARGL